jgi:HlyD family secretion protein
MYTSNHKREQTLQSNSSSDTHIDGELTRLHLVRNAGSKRKKTWIAVASAAVIAIGGVTAFVVSQSHSKQAPAPVAATTAPPVVTVTTELVKLGKVESTLLVTGSVSALDPLTISSQASGLSIAQVLVEEGDTVRKGQVLCILDSSVLQAQLKGMEARMVGSRASALKAEQPNRQEDIAGLQAAYSQSQADVHQRQAMVAQMEAALNNSRSNAKRYRDLLKEGAVSQQESDNHATEEITAATNLQSAKEQLAASKFASQQAGKRLEMALSGGRKEDIIVSRASADETAASVQQLRAQIAQTIVRAPDDGIITKRNAHIGDVASNGEAMFEMIRRGELELRAQVTQDDLSKLHTGTVARLSDSVRTVEGKIFQISPTVDSATRLGTVRIAVPANSGFKPGMFVQGSVKIGLAESLLVPNSAVMADDGQNYVFVYSEGKAHKRNITVGTRTSSQAEVKKGLEKGEPIIVSGAGFLDDNDAVALSN